MKIILLAAYLAIAGCSVQPIKPENITNSRSVLDLTNNVVIKKFGRSAFGLREAFNLNKATTIDKENIKVMNVNFSTQNYLRDMYRIYEVYCNNTGGYYVVSNQNKQSTCFDNQDKNQAYFYTKLKITHYFPEYNMRHLALEIVESNNLEPNKEVLMESLKKTVQNFYKKKTFIENWQPNAYK